MAPPTATLTPPAEDVTEDDFRLDMRVVELAIPLGAECNTDDGCGETCDTSACSTSSFDVA
ncbi:hypothetical protein GCM10010112_82080 [Actinoplanes lobatus]|nr:hypothetical protein GCM10010112_82080 [Actinoplanes lobatus]GIE44713.1 hypothetical protein Alo02nite_76110 [Actinoplanes lobatus]